MLDEDAVLGKGIFTIAEASRLTRISPQSIRRWLYGYSYRENDDHVFRPPVIHHDYEPIDDTYALSFLDLIDVRFVDQFRIHGVSLQTIRLAAGRAAELIGHAHPFATKKFYTDRKTILAQITEDGNEPELIDLAKRQYEIHDIVLPALYAALDFSEFDVAERWWPRGRRFEVVVDPRRSFGRPIMDRSGIPTSVLADAYRAHGSITKAALWYEVDPSEVQAAVQFESNLAA